MRRLMKRRFLVLPIVIAVGALLLASCDVGFDPGMGHECVLTPSQTGSPKDFADTFGCAPGSPAQIVQSGQYWALNSDTNTASGGHCNGDNTEQYPIAAPGIEYPPGSGQFPYHHPDSPLYFGTARNPLAMELQIRGDACQPQTYMTFGLNPNGTSTISGLKSRITLALISRAGHGWIDIPLYITDAQPNQPVEHYTIALAFHNDTVSTNANTCVQFVGRPGNADASHHLIVLNGGCMGLTVPTTSNGWVSEFIDWNTILNHVQGLGVGSWAGLWPDEGSSNTTGFVQVNIQTYDIGGRADILVTNWRSCILCN
jgi:hypothetical protein